MCGRSQCLKWALRVDVDQYPDYDCVVVVVCRALQHGAR
jgi:hypothetical protein